MTQILIKIFSKKENKNAIIFLKIIKFNAENINIINKIKTNSMKYMILSTYLSERALI